MYMIVRYLCLVHYLQVVLQSAETFEKHTTITRRSQSHMSRSLVRESCFLLRDGRRRS